MDNGGDNNEVVNIPRRIYLDRYLPLGDDGSITVSAAQWHRLRYIERYATDLVCALIRKEHGDDKALNIEAAAKEALIEIIAGGNG